MCPLAPERHHGSATGHARGRPFGTEKVSTFFAVAVAVTVTEYAFPQKGIITNYLPSLDSYSYRL